MRIPVLVWLVAVACLCGCGVPGAPLPPSLGIPKPVNDLQATRKGSEISLAWTVPTHTTDGELIRHPGKMVLLRGTHAGGFQTVKEFPLRPAVNEKERLMVSASDNIDALLSSPATPDFVFYRLSSVSSRGRTSFPSNEVSVPAVMTLPPPQKVLLGLAPSGVTISFDVPEAPASGRLNSQYIYRVMRRLHGVSADQKPTLVGQVKPGSMMPMVDTRIEWEKEYDYWVTPVTLWRAGARQGEVEGDDSASATITAHDAFPPAAPSGLQAVFSGMIQHPGIDLTWTPNTEDDLAGYNVYRHSASGAPERINTELLKTPAFHDGNVVPGETYFYLVTAVDLRGNESPRSAETSESVPRQ